MKYRKGVTMEQDIKILERMLKIEKECLHYDVSQDEIRALEHLIKAYKELEEFKKQVTEIENTNFIKYKNYIQKSLVEEKIEEYFEDEEWLVEHDLRALCDDEKECREYYTNKKIALKDIKKAILDKLNKLLKNY